MPCPTCGNTSTYIQENGLFVCSRCFTPWTGDGGESGGYKQYKPDPRTYYKDFFPGIFIASFFIMGLGHMLLGRFKRGLVILATALILLMIVALIPYSWNLWGLPLSYLVTAPLWIWQIYDAFLQVQKYNFAMDEKYR